MNWKLTFLSFALFLLSGAAFAHPSDHEESLRSLLSIDVDKLSIDEASLPLSTLRVSTEAKRTLLSWRVKDNIYTYSLSGPQHEQRAQALLQLFEKGSLTTVVFEKEPYRNEKFAAFRRILAFQWRVAAN